MESEMLLYITLIIYLMVMTFAFMFKVKWLYIMAGLLWFIPMTELSENVWLVIISITMIITHFMLGLTSSEENDF